MKTKVLITGGAGFIGANLARKLLAQGGFSVCILEQKGTNLWRLQDVAKKVMLKEVSLEDKSGLLTAVRKVKPDVIFHLAGYGAYPLVQHDARKMVEINIVGTLNLLAAAQQVGVRFLVNIGSSSEYREKKSAISEEDAVGPANCYGVTKLASTLLVKNMAEEKKLPVINLRPFNVYGSYGVRQGLMPYIILETLRGKEISLSFPNNTRDFIFIDDLIDLFLKIIKSRKQYHGEIFNVGSGQQHSIREVVGLVGKLLGKKVRVAYEQKSPHYQKSSSFRAGISKARKAFGWRPKTDLAVGVSKTVDWFIKNKALYS